MNLVELTPEQLDAGAVALMHRHFEAINAANREAFRETAFLFAQNDGLPFERWWEDLRFLAPFKVAVTSAPHLGQQRKLGRLSAALAS